MAHLQGTDYVGSMVVLEDGLPNKREYRRFKVRDVPGNDDYAAMDEVLTRRLTAYLAERDRPINERRERARQVRVPTAVAPRRRRQGSARRGQAGGRRRSGWPTRSRSPVSPSGSRRCSCPAGRSRSRSRGGARRCSCCSGSATRPTASPTRSTSSAGSKRMTASSTRRHPGPRRGAQEEARQGDGRGQRREAGVARRPQGAAVPPRRRRRGDLLEVSIPSVARTRCLSRAVACDSDPVRRFCANVTTAVTVSRGRR